MPHLIIEYSANVADSHGGPLEVPALVEALHRAALETGIAPLDALRTRAVGREHYAIADLEPDNMFIAVTARLGAGRNDDEKRRFVETLMVTLDEFLGSAQRTIMLSVEYQEIDPASRINKNNLRPLVAERADQQEDGR